VNVSDGRRVKQNEWYKLSGMHATGFSYLIYKLMTGSDKLLLNTIN
jgi:hypothetical protein